VWLKKVLVCLAWLDDVREYAKKDVDITLIGNKVDLVDERQVDFKTAKDFADDNYLPYIEVRGLCLKRKRGATRMSE